MEIQCPACKKVNEAAVRCLRCGCNLSILRKIQESAKRELLTGARRLKNNNGTQALEHARRSWGVKNSPSSARLAFLACILINDFDEATLWYRRANSGLGKN